MNGREKYFNTINFTLSLVQWSHGPVVRRHTFFSWRKLGCGLNPRRGYFQFLFFFLSSYFYPSAFYCLFSLLTLLASRDFCENVFLVMLRRNFINIHCKFGARQKWEPAGRMGDFGNFLKRVSQKIRPDLFSRLNLLWLRAVMALECYRRWLYLGVHIRLSARCKMFHSKIT